MSRIGRNPIPLPAGTKVTINDRQMHVKGKLGELEWSLPEGISAIIEDGNILVKRSGDAKQERAYHGLSRALLANMVTGVNQGFSKTLELVGVGYKAEQRGEAIQLSVGFSHKIICIPPEGVAIKVESATKVSISGIDKHLVGETAASIRKVRPPEPYKGKGIKYSDEVVRRKAGKSTGK